MKLTKQQIKTHESAVEILKKDVLTLEDKYFVIDNWREDANHINSKHGAFFTPFELARDAVYFVEGRKIIDLCAGIGTLSLAYWIDYHAFSSGKRPLELTCVELNPDYVEIGKKILPEAEWICGDVFEVIAMLKEKGRHFDTAISNPPYGNVLKTGFMFGQNAPKSSEHKVIAAAKNLADKGVFVIPKDSGPYLKEVKIKTLDANGKRREHFVKELFLNETVAGFEAHFGIQLNYQAVDTELYEKNWHGVAPKVSIIQVDYDESTDN